MACQDLVPHVRRLVLFKFTPQVVKVQYSSAYENHKICLYTGVVRRGVVMELLIGSKFRLIGNNQQVEATTEKQVRVKGRDRL